MQSAPDMNSTAPDANASLVALRCEQCGGTFDFRVLEAIAVCPYCQHEQRLPADLLAHVASYTAGIDVEQERARLHSLNARRYRAMRPRSWYSVAVVYVFNFMCIVAIAFLLLGGSGGLTVTGVLAVIGLLAVFVASGTITSMQDRRAARDATATSFESACSNCGGMNALAIGQTLADCAFCGAALIPGERVKALGLGLAQALTRATKIDSVLALRELRLTEVGSARLFRSVGMLLSPILPAIMCVVAHKAAGMSLAQSLLVFGGTIVIVQTMIHADPVYQRIVERPIRNSLASIASTPGSTRLAGASGTVRWLNEYWWDEIEKKDRSPFQEYWQDFHRSGFLKDPRLHAVATVKRGFPVLVIASREKFLHIVVATIINVPNVSHKLLSRFGFHVKVCESGVIASLNPKPLAKFGDPGEDQRLVRCIDALVDAVISRGGRPAPRL